jgi:hypothetical protein
MSLLNILTQGEESVVVSVPTQRLVFLVKHLLRIPQSGVDLANIKAEIFKILTTVLRTLSEIYGSHWADSIELLSTTWKETSGGDTALPSLHASFRLFALLKSMANGEGNDDLEDAWAESKTELFKCLVSTLHRLGMYQPLKADRLLRYYRFLKCFPSTSRYDGGSITTPAQCHPGG